MKNITFLSAKSMASFIRKKKLSSEEIMKAHIKQIERVNPKLNAIVQFFPEEALKKARAADIAIAKRKPIGPLHGVPFTVKDTFTVENAIVTMGITGLAKYRSTVNATLVNRLLNAGAILLGITNMAECGLAFETDNLLYGRTNNPYNLKRTPGGSSGGEAAIIAAGGSPLGLGTDLGGSIRLPAHFSGIAGIRPTTSRLSCAGLMFYPLGIYTFFVTAGPMARYVEDLAYTMPILSGTDWKDATMSPVPLRDADNVNIKHLRIAYFIDNSIAKPTKDTANVIQAAIKYLSRETEHITEERPEAVEQAYRLFQSILEMDAGKSYLSGLKKLKVKDMHPLLKALYAKFPKKAYNIFQVNQFFNDWLNYRVAMQTFMQDYDVLITPVNAYPAMNLNSAVTPTPTT